jgi:hypothetical protein
LPTIAPTAAPATASDSGLLRPKSKGEKFFDRAVYGGLAGVGTFLVTLGIAYQLIHGKLLGGHYTRVVDWVEKKAVQVFSPSTSKKIAKEGVLTSTLMMGGNAMLLPVGLAEHYKTPIVRGLNVTLGDSTPPEAIEQSPKQTWSSLIQGRLLAWGVVFASLTAATSKRFGIPKTFTLFQEEVAEKIYRITQSIKGNPTPALGDITKTTSYKVGHLAAVDVFATAAAAILLYVGGHFFARKHEEKKERKTPRLHSLPVAGLEGEKAADAREVAPLAPSEIGSASSLAPQGTTTATIPSMPAQRIVSTHDAADIALTDSGHAPTTQAAGQKMHQGTLLEASPALPRAITSAGL